uniref:TBC1 domain family member 2B-like isoform X1 n=1 Tax=Styela clava TaxID=7725 RepID=UPI001939DA56|nr:TBC1 domain family member 2B-like isoform X1 [Styela clava]
MADKEATPCPTDILVDIGDESEAFEIIQPLSPEECNTNEDRLCGYLAKVSQGGFIKGSKTRWFVFDKETCSLNYYRSPKDTAGNPLGSIPISSSAFTCTADGLLVNSFQIMHETRTHVLQACDQKTMLWWLQELQTERRVFNTKQTQRSSSRIKPKADTEADTNPAVLNIDEQKSSGLIDKFPGESEVKNPELQVNRDCLSVIPVLPRIENPPDTVGIKSANMNIKQGSSGLPGLSDFGNKVTQLGEGIAKMRIKPPRPAPPAPTSVFYSKHTNPDSEEHLTLGPALKATKSTETKNKRPRSRTTAGITHLLDKIQTTVKSGGKISHHDSKHVEEITGTLNLVKEEIELMKTSLESKEETIELLKKELDMYSSLTTTNTKPIPTVSEEPGSPSSHHQMRSEITTLKLTIEHLREEVDETKLSFRQQEEKTKLFQEMLQVKDGIVVQLTNELYEMEKSYKSLVNEHASEVSKGKDSALTDNPSAQQLTESSSSLESDKTAVSGEAMTEFKKLKDEVEGYRLQNKFLNNEILELTHLREVDRNKMDSLHDKILHQEALHCQLQSKYFILLSEMDRNRSETLVYSADTENPLLHQEEGGSSKPNVVKQLIQEAIKEGECRAEEISASFKSSKYDRYGFTQVVDDGDESTFLSAASRLQQHASNIVNSIEEHDATVANKWQKYVAENKEWQRNGEFKSLVRLGIPHDLRHKVWRYLVHIRTYELRQQLNADGTYYTRLTETTVAPLHAKQIDLDLLRTLPSNRFFASMECVGIQQLRRVLRAYSLHNPGIGYCQGLNRMAAVSLLYLGEEDAFWCLVAIVECIMPSEYYTPTLTASQADQRVFRDLLAEKLPRLHRHFENMGIDLSLITFNWFLCIYCDNVPPETMFKIWDIFLNESSKVLFRFGLAFFKHIEEDILELNDYMTLFNLLRRMSHRMYDARVLTQIAFQGMNPFPMRKIRRFRLIHMEKVQAELEQLDLLRNEFASRRNKASSNSDMYSDDEGDD